MPQDPFQDDYRRVRRERSRFGNVDTSGPEEVQGTLDIALKAMVLRRHREIARRSAELERNYVSEKLGGLEQTFRSGRRNQLTGAVEPFSGRDVNAALDITTIDLLKYGGERARRTASDIQKLRKQEKTDLSTTPEEAYLRGQIDFNKYRAIKQAGKTEDKESYRWRQQTKNGKPATSKIGTKTHLVEEEIDMGGKPTGSTRLKGVAESRSSLFGFSSGGKGSLDIPFVNATTGLIQYRKATGTAQDILAQIKMNAKAIDETVRKLSEAEGKTGFLGIGSRKAWQSFLDDDAVNIDDLPESLQPYAAALEELNSRKADLQGEDRGDNEKETIEGW